MVTSVSASENRFAHVRRQWVIATFDLWEHELDFTHKLLLVISATLFCVIAAVGRCSQQFGVESCECLHFIVDRICLIYLVAVVRHTLQSSCASKPKRCGDLRIALRVCGSRHSRTQRKCLELYQRSRGETRQHHREHCDGQVSNLWLVLAAI